MIWIRGTSSASETLTSADDIYETHIDQLRESHSFTAVVGKTSNCQYYCDGTADQVQIQAALDAVDTAGGGKVLIKAGTYLLDEPLVIGDYIHIQGEGMGNTILKMADASFEGLLADYFVTADLPTLTLKKQFVGLPANSLAFLQAMAVSKHSGAGSGVPVADWCKYVTVSDITFDANAANQTYRSDTLMQYAIGGGPGLYPAGWLTYQRVEVKNFSGFGISAYGACDPDTNIPWVGAGPERIFDCFIHDGGIGQTIPADTILGGIIVDDQGSYGTIVSGNYISDLDGLTGIFVEDTDLIKLTNNYINNTYDAIALASAPHTFISDNYIYETERDGIRFTGDNHQSSVSNNMIMYPGRYGMIVQYIECIDNKIFHPGDVGLYVGGAFNFVDGNHIYNPGQDDDAVYSTGILLEGSLGGSQIINNKCIDDHAVAGNPKGAYTMDYGFKFIGDAARVDNVVFTGNSSYAAIIANFELSGITWGINTHAQFEATTAIYQIIEKSYDTISGINSDMPQDLPDASAGWGFVQVGDNKEYASFSWTSAAVVTLISSSANVVNTDTDTKFCIFDNGTTVRLRNRLASNNDRVRYKIWYSVL